MAETCREYTNRGIRFLTDLNGNMVIHFDWENSITLAGVSQDLFWA